jgi:2-hydroxychromene-2-carboxylate isomerase
MTTTNGKSFDFFFDLASPYSYLAATQIDALAERVGAEIRYRPMVLSAVFKATANTMPAVVLPKARYMLRDLERWAASYDVPFRMTSRFPVNALRTMRAIIATAAEGKDKAFTLRAYQALWVEDRDITTDAELRSLLSDVGANPDAILAAIETQNIKDRLRAYTDEAIARGVFGAPAFLIQKDGGDELFWGNDRLHFLEHALQ